MTAEQRGDDYGVQDQSESQAKTSHQRTGEEGEKEDVREIEHRRERGQEPRQVVTAVLRLRTVEEEEVQQLRAHRGQHLVDEQEEDEAGREQHA